MTAKYGVPYFSNFINSDMDPDDARSMCCRLRLDNRELRKRGGGLFGANPLTGSIGVVTINLARLGYLSKGKDLKFLFNKIDKLMDLSRESLVIKRKALEKLTEQNLYPYSKFWLRNIKKRFGEYWKNHFNTIGLNGMNECLLNYIDKGIATKEGLKIAVKILDHMRDKLKEYQLADNELYNLEATPAEGCTYRFAKKDLELYPDIVFANNEAVKKHQAKPYYTNSTHLPVGTTDDVFEALDLQDELQTKYTGGTVLHGFIGERIDDPEACKKLVRKIAENYRLPYYTITPTFSICPKHGYLAGEHFFCPKCDEEIGYKPEKATKKEVKRKILQPQYN
jgi:ribonucleoside-triphosphate reductase